MLMCYSNWDIDVPRTKEYTDQLRLSRKCVICAHDLQVHETDTCESCKYKSKVRNRKQTEKRKKEGLCYRCNKHIGRYGICQDCSSRDSSKLRRYSYNRNLKKNFGITIEDYERMYNSQNGRCAICERPLGRAGDCGEKHRDGSVLCVDHCHQTGHIRGLLCTDCNLGLGHFEKTGARISNIAKYLGLYSQPLVNIHQENK